MGNLTLCLAVCTAIPLPFARAENMQTLNPSTFESETRADNEDQISFISICYPKAERSYIFDSSRNTRKTCMLSGSPTWNKKSKVWEVVSCVSIPLVHPLYYSLTSPNILAVCGDSRLFCASFTAGCQKGEIPAPWALSWRILLCNSQSKAKPVSVSFLQISCRVQHLSPLLLPITVHPTSMGFLAACIPIPQSTTTRREEPHVLSYFKEPASIITHPSRKCLERTLVLSQPLLYRRASVKHRKGGTGKRREDGSEDSSSLCQHFFCVKSSTAGGVH